MIGQLTGKIVNKNIPHLIIDCNGVGYEVEATMAVFDQINNIDVKTDVITIYTHLSVREDAHVLFGFISIAERNAFRILIKVSGIGPKSAVLILSGMSVADLAQTIATGDAYSLTQLPGIGKKTAERLVLELKDKFTNITLQTNGATTGKLSTSQSEKYDAVNALVALGYKIIDADKMVNNVYADDLDSETLIRKALQAKLK